jgi:hypothetical protein
MAGIPLRHLAVVAGLYLSCTILSMIWTLISAGKPRHARLLRDDPMASCGHYATECERALHLACMQVIGRVVPSDLAATAQAIYGMLAIAAVTSVLTLASGSMYGRVGAAGSWAMAALSIPALPFIFRLRLVLSLARSMSATAPAEASPRARIRSAR